MDTTTKRHKVEEILKTHFCDEGLRDYLTDIHNNGNSLVCSNGHLLAEISLDKHPQLKDIGVYVGNFPDYEGLIPVETEQTMTIDVPVSDLISEVNDKDPVECDCPKCNGDGGVDHYCDCEYCQEDFETCGECGGSGRKEKGDRFRSYIKIGDYYFRAAFLNHIAGLFQSVRVPTCTLWLQPKEDAFTSIPIIVQSEGIRVLCMPVFLEGLNIDTDYSEITKTIKL